MNKETSRKYATYNFVPFKIRSMKMLGSQKIDRQGIVPEPIHGHKTVCDEEDLYLAGGSYYYPQLWRYNIASGLWKKMDERKTGVLEYGEYSSLIQSGKLLFVSQYVNMSDPEEIWPKWDFKHYWFVGRVDQDDLRFNKIPITAPFNFTVDDATLVGENLIASNYDNTFKANLKGRIWKTAAITNRIQSTEIPLNKKTFQQPILELDRTYASDGTYLFQIGGTYLVHNNVIKIPCVFDKIIAIHLTTGKRKEMVTYPDESDPLESFPALRRFHSSAQFGDDVYILGGEQLTTYEDIVIEMKKRTLLRDIWKLNLKTLKWSKLHNFSLPEGIRNHSSCVTPSGKLFVFGGIENSERVGLRMTHTRETNNLYTAWLTVPTLKEMSWEAVCHYHPKLSSQSSSQLLSSGIPWQFVRRLKR